MSKLALLLALAIGALALCDAQTDPPSQNFTCPGGGSAFDGNNRPEFFPSCDGASVFCETGDCADIGPCVATCNDGSVLTLTREDDGYVTVRNASSAEVDVGVSIFKGCDAYCLVPADGTPTTPIRENGSPCGLSHADFCYTPSGPPNPPPVVPSPPPPVIASPPPPVIASPPPPVIASPPPPVIASPPPPVVSSPPPPGCKCAKNQVTFYCNGAPVKDISLCPGKPLPDKTKYTAKDNCGNTLPVKVQDSSRRPGRGPCFSITRTLTAPCLYAKVTKYQKITYEDSIIFSSGCPVKATSKCKGWSTVVTPVVSYTNCVFKAVFKAKDCCGIVQTKIVTKY